MHDSALLAQLLNGLAEASILFLVAAGLSLIFGVSRIVNFAHGSLCMVGLYLGYSLTERLGATPLGFWACVLAAALAVAVLGAVIELLLLRRIYRAPELFQLLATFALVLIINDATLWLWGPEDLLGRRAPGLAGAIVLWGRPFPTYSLVLAAIGPAVLALAWLLLTRTRWGKLLRAATQDRDMLGALGVNQAWLFTSVFALGAFLAGLGGAVQVPREPATLGLDLRIIADAFVVVVVGGMGSLPGAYVAALIIAELKALCIAVGSVQLGGVEVALSHLTQVADFLVMALVLALRPWGLFGRPQSTQRGMLPVEQPGPRPGLAARRLAWGVVAACVLLPLAASAFPYALVLATEMLIAVLFATSLYFMMGPGGMPSFGHAAFFGLGAYGAALLVKAVGLPMELALLLAPAVAAVGALLSGWFCVRLSGVYMAMLTLAFAQIIWSVAWQWDGFTGGSNGLTGVWPAAWLASTTAYYYLTLACTVAGVLVLRRMMLAPLGQALRAGRDSPLRAEASGIDVLRVRWTVFAVAGAWAGLAGGLYAYSKGSIGPDVMSINRSVDVLVMVLLGGVQSLAGPIVGAAAFVWLQDTVARLTEYWHALLGIVMLLLVMVFPGGVAGGFARLAGVAGQRLGRRP